MAGISWMVKPEFICHEVSRAPVATPPSFGEKWVWFQRMATEIRGLPRVVFGGMHNADQLLMETGIGAGNDRVRPIGSKLSPQCQRWPHLLR
jgi:hypothetical protein